MAREEQDREDLLAEATALVERIELRVAGRAEHVFAGFRVDGCGSVYLGHDEVYHFNARHRLRRVYLGGILYKAQRGRLLEVTRQRAAGRVRLETRELDAEQTQALLKGAGDALGHLHEALKGHDCDVVGQVPEGADVVGRVTAWLDKLQPLQIADAPHAR